MLHTSSGMLIQFSNFLNKFSFFEYLLATSHQHPGKSADRLSPSPARARYQFHTAYKWVDRSMLMTRDCWEWERGAEGNRIQKEQHFVLSSFRLRNMYW